LTSLLAFALDYAGILSSPVDEQPGRPVDLLLLRNLFDGHEKLRLLDIKVGQKTAAAGWQGKSRFRALKQGVLDGLTNSVEEGFRLEGFDGRPPALESRDALIDLVTVGGLRGLAIPGLDGPKLRKKARRIFLQRMHASDIISNFLDVHQEPGDLGDASLEEYISPTEYAELVLHETIVRLARLAIACILSPVPHKWIGSSVALGFDAGGLPPRSRPEQEVRQKVLVRTFDWGRSELNTLDGHMKLSAEEQTDRAEFWKYYTGGINRLSWEVARSYWHRFSNAKGWTKAYVIVHDFDSTSETDHMGMVEISPLEEMSEVTMPLASAAGGVKRKDPPMLTLSISRRTYPIGSRLSHAWRIHVVGASNLPTAADTFAEVTALAFEGDTVRFELRQQTSVVVSSADPVWNATFEVSVAARKYLLGGALAAAEAALTCEPCAPADRGSEKPVRDVIPWIARLQEIATASTRR